MVTGTYGVLLYGYLRSVSISGYRGPASLLKELIQNADDARSFELEFELHNDTLIVRNDSQFTEKDFLNIKSIAAGGKRSDSDATGTWGTGFTSVFQLTDNPEIRSRDQHLVFDPIDEKCRVTTMAVIEGTEFRFPWRLQESAFS